MRQEIIFGLRQQRGGSSWGSSISAELQLSSYAVSLAISFAGDSAAVVYPHTATAANFRVPFTTRMHRSSVPRLAAAHASVLSPEAHGGDGQRVVLASSEVSGTASSTPRCPWSCLCVERVEQRVWGSAS